MKAQFLLLLASLLGNPSELLPVLVCKRQTLHLHSFTTLGLSERAYRGLKQGSIDPLKVWARLRKLSDDDLRELGGSRLREALGG